MAGQVVSMMDAFPTSDGPGGGNKISLGSDKYQMTDLLRLAVDNDASDLHLVVGRPAVLRIDGVLVDIDGPVLTGQETRRLIYGVLNDHQKQMFEDKKDLDFSLAVANLYRFRVNVHLQRNTVAAAFRIIESKIRSFKELRLPPKVLEYLCRRPHGFVLVTGPTGSGKSTTLAACVDLINTERACHIITVEDPIEYIHSHKMALIEQRELEMDTFSFADALKFALRQDPDVILIGEMRDLDTMSAAITAAETGHLVFSTLHTNDVVQTVDRIIDVFPAHQQEQVRIQLAGIIEGILCQKLLPTIGGGRAVALEMMIATDAIRNQIRESQTHQVHTTMEASGRLGMQTMDRAVLELYKARRITKEVALHNALKAEEMVRVMEKSDAV